MLAFDAAAMKDSGKRCTVDAAEAKLFAANHSLQICIDAQQVLGGNGYSKEYHVERFVRDARIFSVAEGTNEILRMNLNGKDYLLEMPIRADIALLKATKADKAGNLQFRLTSLACQDYMLPQPNINRFPGTYFFSLSSLPSPFCKVTTTVSGPMHFIALFIALSV